MHHGAQSARDGQLRQTSARGVQGVPPAFKILVSPLPKVPSWKGLPLGDSAAALLGHCRLSPVAWNVCKGCQLICAARCKIGTSEQLDV
jgi:hypothetical protein